MKINKPETFICNCQDRYHLIVANAYNDDDWREIALEYHVSWRDDQNVHTDDNWFIRQYKMVKARLKMGYKVIFKGYAEMYDEWCPLYQNEKKLCGDKELMALITWLMVKRNELTMKEELKHVQNTIIAK